jgi:hypothetical protein
MQSLYSGYIILVCRLTAILLKALFIDRHDLMHYHMPAGAGTCSPDHDTYTRRDLRILHFKVSMELHEAIHAGFFELISLVWMEESYTSYCVAILIMLPPLMLYNNH